ncbi:aminopeptidase [Sinobacterium caligoides]|uniref:aminopeptidase n=1 Tax=Sinobacterium caligoides TaxID=933926 RepID=UPI0013C32F5C|nr:aminopeptidase [Sinobacterium caligoides]
MLTLVVTLLLSGCGQFGYYWQAGKGQWSVLSSRQPIDSLLSADSTDEILKLKLQHVQQFRQFAEQQLLLESGGSYRHFVALDDDYVVWNVYAAKPLSVESYQWCYPLLGCMGYRGYFQKSSAIAYAEQLAEEGLEVHVGGVTAYSTLGWFNDPVLSSFLGENTLDLAALLFHELAHRKIYVRGDTAFNESFATAVAHLGIAQWLATDRVAQQDPAAFQHWQRQQARASAFIELLLEAREELSAIYCSGRTVDGKLQAKDKAYLKLQTRYRQYAEQWHYRGYDAWMADINNAQLATVGDYNLWLKSFEALYRQNPGDWQLFYQGVQQLAELPRKERVIELELLKSR